jgi:hypothetical protein
MEKNRLFSLYFGRIHISSLGEKKLEKTDLKTKLLEFLEKSPPINDKSKEYLWHIGNMQEIDDSIYGILGKVRTSIQLQVYDEAKRIFISKSGEKNLVQNLSHFWFFPDKYIVVFERSNIIGEIQFQNLLKQGFSQFFNKVYEVDIDLLQDKKEINKIIREADKVIQFELNVRPTNPDPNPDADRIDKILQEMNVTTSNMKFSNNKSGLNFTKKNNLISSGIALCSMGYGTFRSVYIKAKERFTIDSKKKIVKERIKLPEDTEGMQKKVKALMLKKLKELEDG